MFLWQFLILTVIILIIVGVIAGKFVSVDGWKTAWWVWFVLIIIFWFTLTLITATTANYEVVKERELQMTELMEYDNEGRSVNIVYCDCEHKATYEVRESKVWFLKSRVTGYYVYLNVEGN